ncbi:hypothetical protein Leryth_026082 [Lithospermum erythrorhizon]|nr:hypothetical protein Leryth_026082 [Lithospermum erythrorhizon]
MEQHEKIEFDDALVLNISSTESNHVTNKTSPNSVSTAWPKSSRPIVSSINKRKTSTLKQSPIESLRSRNISFSKASNVNNEGRKWEILDLIEFISFLILLGFLIPNLATDKLTLWEVEVWRFSVLIIIIFCGNLVTKLLTNFIAFLIEKSNNFLKSDVLYVVHVMIKSSRALVWLGLIIISWLLLIKGEFNKSSRSDNEQRVLNKITRGMVCTLVGTFLWMLNTFLVKLLASSFHLRTFFDRVREAIFFQYVFRQLSGGKIERDGTSEQEWERVEKLWNLNKDNVSAFFMTQLIEEIDVYGLTEKKWTEYEKEAKFVAAKMMKIVANEGKEYIDEGDLGRFLPSGAIVKLLQLIIEGSEENLDTMESTTNTDEIPETSSSQIEKSSFELWTFESYKELKCLAYSLNNSNTAIDELNKISSIVVIILIVIVWLLLMGITTTEVLVFIASQLLTWGFIFSNTLTRMFEGIIFNFFAHPFDVADRCVIDGIEMVVEEMGLLTTIFLRNDNERIHYSNSVLATMPISNFKRSSKMTEIVEFGVDFSTSAQSLSILKRQIKGYLESTPQNWLKDHTLEIKEAEDESKEMKMFLNVIHTASVQPSNSKNMRSDLVLQLTSILDGLNVKYQILPQ